MRPNAEATFTIDVDIAPLLGSRAAPTLVDAGWYTLSQPHPNRQSALQAKVERAFRNTILRAQWEATVTRARERRRAIRVPLLSRVHDAGASTKLGVTTDISLAGVRCTGRPQRELLDIEFRLPGLGFPVDARAEVVNFRDGNVFPLMGLRFVDIDTPYLGHIAAYVQRRCLKQLAA